MKTRILLFIAAGLGVLTLGTSLGEQPAGQGAGGDQAPGMHAPATGKGNKTDAPSEDKSPAPGNPKQTKKQATTNKPADQKPGHKEQADEEGSISQHPKSTVNHPVSSTGSHGGPVKTLLPAPLHHKPVATSPAIVKRIEHPAVNMPAVSNIHEPALTPPAPNAVVRTGLIANRIATHPETSVKRLPAGPTGPASLIAVPAIRRTGAASIGQLAPSTARTSTAALNGTGMKIKP